MPHGNAGVEVERVITGRVLRSTLEQAGNQEHEVKGEERPEDCPPSANPRSEMVPSVIRTLRICAARSPSRPQLPQIIPYMYSAGNQARAIKTMKKLSAGA